MFRSQNHVHLPPRQTCPVSPSALSVNSVLRKTRSLTCTDPSISDTQERPQPLSTHTFPNTFRHIGGVLPPELKTASRFSAFSSLATDRSALSSIESALTQNALITCLESPLPKTQHLKPFRIRTYEKTGGRGYSLPSVNCTLLPPATWPAHRGAMPHA
jgi:hypothetical protein